MTVKPAETPLAAEDLAAIEARFAAGVLRDLDLRDLIAELKRLRAAEAHPTEEVTR